MGTESMEEKEEPSVLLHKPGKNAHNGTGSLEVKRKGTNRDEKEGSLKH